MTLGLVKNKTKTRWCVVCKNAGQDLLFIIYAVVVKFKSFSLPTKIFCWHILTQFDMCMDSSCSLFFSVPQCVTADVRAAKGQDLGTA